MSQTVRDLFNKEREAWLNNARKAAKKLLKTRSVITIEDVLSECPRPQFVHRNTTGRVFNDLDFVAVGWRHSSRPLMKGRQVREWTLRK